MNRLMALAITWFNFLYGTPDYEVRPRLFPEYYDTINQAGLEAVHQAYERSQFYEYGGTILRTTNGKYRISVPETDYRADGVFLDPDRRPDFAGYTTVADYHTHPCMPYSHYPRWFSDGDVGSNLRTTLVGFMGDLCTGIVYRFVPGVTMEDKCWPDDIEKGHVCGSSGEYVGRFQLTRQPVIVERVGPQHLKRGKLK